MLLFLILFVFYVPTVPEEHYEEATLILHWLSIDEEFTTLDRHWLAIPDPTAPPTGSWPQDNRLSRYITSF